MIHPAFTLKNLNRARNLISSFCKGNPSQFHAADGSGYALTVTGNWRITFRFDGEDAIDLNLEVAENEQGDKIDREVLPIAA